MLPKNKLHRHKTPDIARENKNKYDVPTSKQNKDKK